MKIYIASSWKMSDICLSLSGLIRSWGHEVDCFCDESTGRFVLDYRELGSTQELDAINFLEFEKTQKSFIEDKKHLDWSEAVVMVLPCGKSAHLEAGYVKGQGKRLYILGEFPKGEFDVMYGFANGLYRWELDKLKADLEV